MFFLHDGRAPDLLTAILDHSSASNLVSVDLSTTLILGLSCVATNGGYAASEADTVIQNFNALSVSDKQSVLDFLRSL